ncbi:hypothetical protein Glove_276g11 [Diversispora epigaea]|uniref:Protein kinase domain-containing protein n=1 Tax=Diversispora epigaea TaxID=1348612 RepID=A0A397I847_9GLOM|nr:hypothetical protein Glove_276g11 [Diversispora epigaea]
MIFTHEIFYQKILIAIIYIGLSRLIGKNGENPQKRNVFGVLPYIAPEVLSGNEEYTKAADKILIAIIYIGLSRLIGKNGENPQKRNVFGVLPYIAPEVLSGNEEYTKAADV